MSSSKAGKKKNVKTNVNSSRKTSTSGRATPPNQLTIGERVALMKQRGVGSIRITVANTISELKIGRIYPEATEGE